MSSNNNIACPLDCFDACQAQKIDDNIKGSDENITNKKLCVNFASLLKQEYLQKPIYKGNEISLNEAIDILVEKLKNTNPEDTIYYKGAGNIGLMQKAPKAFFSQYGSVLTKGGLCDEIGNEGIEQGRNGVNINPPLEKLLEADVIISWGRNFCVTSSHMYNQVKDKTLITIDPIKTKTAKKSDLHLQINPKTDYELALMFTRLAHMSNLDDEEFLEEYCEGYDWFFDIAKNRPLVSYEATTGVGLDEVYKFFDLIEGKSVAIMIGVGVQKYFEGAQIMRCIDSFAAYMGYHNPKTAGGVWYLSNSSYGYKDQFETKSKNKKVCVPEMDFSKYEVSFIQGADPVVSNPNTQSIINGLENSFVVYFGTTFNETCKYADLIIPSSSFLSKLDVRSSYGNRHISISDVIEEKNENSLSEYELTSILLDKFGFENLKDEEKIIEYYKNTEVDYEELESFEFIEDIDIEPLYKDKTEEDFYLITAKKDDSLNSQFKIDNNVYLNSSTGYKDGDSVKISSKYGEANFSVKISDDIKSNCAFFFSGNRFINYLTPNKEDEVANSTMFQEVLIQIELS